MSDRERSAPRPTTEREITEPVDLCTPDGRRLNPAARGWARQPLFRANLGGRWGRTKRWDYWAVLAGDLAVSITYSDVDVIGIAGVWWGDLATGETGGRDVTVPLARGLDLPDRPGTEPLRFRSRHLDLDLVDDEAGTRLQARWTERDGAAGQLDVMVDQPEGHESLNVVIPWSDRLFQHTGKHQARPARGSLIRGSDVRAIGGEAGEAWGVLDVGRGRWPYRTNWNWGGGAGRAEDGAVVGVQIGGRWTEGTGFTENGILVDGRLTKIGAELEWTYDWDAPLEPWRVVDPDGHLDLTLVPIFDKVTDTNAGIMAMAVHQVFGRWTGTVTDDHGVTHRVEGIQGFAEECRARW